MRSVTKRLIDECREADIAPLYVMDNVIPVLHSSRPATALVYDINDKLDYDGLLQKTADSSCYRALESVVSRYGIKVGVGAQGHPHGKRILSKIYLFRDGGDDLRDIDNLFRKAHCEMSNGEISESYGEALRCDGKFLGYSDCCIESAVADDIEHMNILASRGMLGDRGYSDSEVDELAPGNKRMLRHMQKILGGDRIDMRTAVKKISKLSPRVRFSYFTNAFYACEPGCLNAFEVGRRVSTSYLGDDPMLAELYTKIVLPHNIMFVYTLSIKESGLPKPQSLYNFSNKCIAGILNKMTAHASGSGIDSMSIQNIIDHLLDNSSYEVTMDALLPKEMMRSLSGSGRKRKDRVPLDQRLNKSRKRRRGRIDIRKRR